MESVQSTFKIDGKSVTVRTEGNVSKSLLEYNTWAEAHGSSVESLESDLEKNLYIEGAKIVDVSQA